MNQDFEFFKTTMPESRKADYYLGCLDGSVFIDFSRLSNDQISLIRISFDGYGCCNLDNKAELLNKEESALLIKELDNEPLNQEVITALVKKAIEINAEHIWNDALEEFGLIGKNKKNT